MIGKTFSIYMVLMTLFVSCGKQKSDTTQGESVETELTSEVPEVETAILQTVDFEHELVSNGHVSAGEIAELRFAVSTNSSVPVRIFVKNGDHVTAGAAIAMLDTFLLSNTLRQAEDNLQKATLDLKDVLIGQGKAALANLDLQDIHTGQGDAIGDSAIDGEALHLAKIRSGYGNAKTQYELAKYNMDNAILRSPISGTVIDLFSKTHAAINTSEPFCRIINRNSLEVDFKILENELPLIKTGDRVKILPYSTPDMALHGNIININPSVDRDGTVRIKASVQPDSRLFNGMNVRISVFRSLGKQWVVAKTAVVLRTGKQVVFAYGNGKAAWHYVTTGYENATQYTITSETLREGDEIIISGNEHLADGTGVSKISKTAE